MNPLRSDLDHVLLHTRAIWEDLRDSRIFLTGGTGFYGCWLLETFLYAKQRLGLDARITVLTRSIAAFAKKAPHLGNAREIEFIEGRLTDFAFPDGAFSHVIHAAVDYTDPLGLFASIVDGTRRTLEFARISGVRRYLLASSGAVYGAQPADVLHLPETYTGAPDCLRSQSAYGEGKRAAEFLCAAYHEACNVETTIARGFAFVGPYLALEGGAAVGNFIRDALQKRPVTVQSDGTAYRSYLYAADLAIWLWTILCRGQACRAYNVGSDAALTIKELAEIVTEVVAPGIPVKIMRAPTPGKSAERYVPDIDRARNELALESWVDLRDGVRRTAAWWAQRNP